MDRTTPPLTRRAIAFGRALVVELVGWPSQGRVGSPVQGNPARRRVIAAEENFVADASGWAQSTQMLPWLFVVRWIDGRPYFSLATRVSYECRCSQSTSACLARICLDLRLNARCSNESPAATATHRVANTECNRGTPGHDTWVADIWVARPRATTFKPRRNRPANMSASNPPSPAFATRPKPGRAPQQRRVRQSPW